MAELYPDIAEAGGLGSALQLELKRCGSPLDVKDCPGMNAMAYARVEHEGRSSQLLVAAEERSFSCDFWHRGVLYASGRASDLSRCAGAIDLFARRRAPIEELIGDHAWVRPAADGQEHEQGRLSEHAWETYLRLPLDHLPVPELEPIIRLASQQPALRQLLPYTSLNRFCVSRTLGYPYTDEEPMIEPVGPGRYRVYRQVAPDWEIELLGDGNAAEAVALMVRGLPPGCGPAVDGTAEDL